MKLKTQKRIASTVLKVGKKRVWFDKNRLEEIKEAITKLDIRGLIGDKAIQAKPKKSISRIRARKRLIQKRKGRRSGPGSREGKHGGRLNKKTKWINTIRSQRTVLKEMKEKDMLTTKDYRILYAKAKGGFFRSKRHIRVYTKEHGMIKNDTIQKKAAK